MNVTGVPEKHSKLYCKLIFWYWLQEKLEQHNQFSKLPCFECFIAISFRYYPFDNTIWCAIKSYMGLLLEVQFPTSCCLQHQLVPSWFPTKCIITRRSSWQDLNGDKRLRNSLYYQLTIYRYCIRCKCFYHVKGGWNISVAFSDLSL